MDEAGERQSFLRIAYVGGTGLFLVVVVVQFFLAGLGVFGATSFDAHTVLGHLLWMLAVVLVVLAFLARLPRLTLLLTGGLAVLSVVQSVLPFLRDDAPAVAALHPVLALAIFLLAHALVRRSSRYLASKIAA